MQLSCICPSLRRKPLLSRLLLRARQQRDIDRLLHGWLTNAVSASPTAKGRA